MSDVGTQIALTAIFISIILGGFQVTALPVVSASLLMIDFSSLWWQWFPEIYTYFQIPWDANLLFYSGWGMIVALCLWYGKSLHTHSPLAYHPPPTEQPVERPRPSICLQNLLLRRHFSSGHFFIIPDVTITNSSIKPISINASLKVTLFSKKTLTLMPEQKSISEWEQGLLHYYGQGPCLIFPLNLQPEKAARGYIAYRVDGLPRLSLNRERRSGLRQQHCRVDFTDYLSNPPQIICTRHILYTAGWEHQY